MLAKPDACPVTIAKASEDVTKQLHWMDGKNPDLVHVKFILDSEGPNNNWDYMPRAQLLAAHGTAVYKPIDMEHVIVEDNSMTFMSKDRPPVRNTICGVMTATAVAWASTGEILTEKEIKGLDLSDKWDRPDEDKIAVVAWGALYSFLFPKTVADLTKAIAEDEMFVSMERWIGKHDYLVWNEKDDTYDTLSRENAVEQAIADLKQDDRTHLGKWSRHQMVNGKAVYRRSLSYVYGGVANTDNPANKMSRFVEPTYLKAAASQQAMATLGCLVRLHDGIHQRFQVAPAAESPKLIAYHSELTRAIAGRELPAPGEVPGGKDRSKDAGVRRGGRPDPGWHVGDVFSL